MEAKRRFVIKRVDGKYMNFKFEPVSMPSAARFSSIEDYHAFMCSYYAPDNPSLYVPQEIEITYQEVANDEHGDL